VEKRVLWVLTIALIVGLSNALMAPGRCDVQPRSRENCGYPGITEIECSSKQCCFESNVLDVPWCFKPGPEDG
uniref:P-type domain-containing protein n=1 Tax=Sphenodon punctatus TaxID=8508 RepID=A0A8D0H7I1_SPHPU